MNLHDNQNQNTPTSTENLVYIDTAVIVARQFTKLKTAYIELAKSYHNINNCINPTHHTSLSVYNCTETTCRVFMAKLKDIENGNI